MRNISVEFQSY